MQLITTKNGQLAIEVAYASAEAGRKIGGEIVLDGTTYVITGRGQAFRRERERLILVYVKNLSTSA